MLWGVENGELWTRARTLIRQLACVSWMLMLAAQAQAGEVFLMGEHVGYGVTRAAGESCFAIAPARVTSDENRLLAMRPGIYRLPANVEQSFDQGFSILRIEGDGDLCESGQWPDGANLDIVLARTRIGSLVVGTADGTSGHMYVRVTGTDPAGYLEIAPVRATDKLMSGMVGSRVVLEEQDAGLLLSVDEEANVGRVIRQDFLTRLIAPFFRSWTEQPGQAPSPAAETTPSIEYRFFIGKQSWRNNPHIVGTRVFVGSSGTKKNQPDALDGVYSFDLQTGKQVWFVPSQSDFNDLTYIKGLVIGGADDGGVMAVGARSGKTYWSRQFESPVTAQPVATGGAVAVATTSGEIFVLNPADGMIKLNTRVAGAVSGGLAADRGGLWIATEAGGLYRFAGYGEVQMRRNSNVYYPDALGYKLSGTAIKWYDKLGSGKGLRARILAAPLVLDDSVVLSLVREDDYDYPPVMAFKKDGTLRWIGTDPNRVDGSLFGSSHLTPAPWYNRLILADDDSNSIYSISRETGEIVWATSLGHRGFQLWSSPVISHDNVYLATYDGFLHKFSASDGHRIWSMYLGQHDKAGQLFLADEPVPDVTHDPQWRAMPSSPILSTPAVSENTIVVGTEEGYLYVINDPQ